MDRKNLNDRRQLLLLPQLKGQQEFYSNYLINSALPGDLQNTEENENESYLQVVRTELLSLPFKLLDELSHSLISAIQSVLLMPVPPPKLPFASLSLVDIRISSEENYVVINNKSMTYSCPHQECIVVVNGYTNSIVTLCEAYPTDLTHIELFKNANTSNLHETNLSKTHSTSQSNYTRVRKSNNSRYARKSTLFRQIGNQKSGRKHPPKPSSATEETQYGARSVMQHNSSLSTVSLWRALSKFRCTVILPHRDFSPKQLYSDHSKLSAQNMSSSYDGFTARTKMPACQRGEDSKSEMGASSSPKIWTKREDAPVDFEKISLLLHASEYIKVIQLIENTPGVDDFEPQFKLPTYFAKGVAYYKISEYIAAKSCFKKSEELAIAIKRAGDIMICNAYLGDGEYAQESYLTAATHYERAAQHFSHSDCASLFLLTPPTASALHAKRASSFRSLSKMVEAVSCYKSAIDNAESDKDVLSACTSLGNLYQSMGDKVNSLEQYKKCIKLSEKLSDYVSLGWAHGNIGNAYLGLNRKDEAVHHLQKSLDLAVEYEQTPQAIGRTYNNLGTAYQSMNDLDKAEEYYDLALSQAVYGNDIAGQARVYGNIGNVHMLRKNYERATPHYSEVLRLSSDPATISTARHNRGCAYYEWATLMLKKQSTAVYILHGCECNTTDCLAHIPAKAKELFHKGSEDLLEVVKHHEEKFQHIKGSKKALTLSVSLHETNSRTFHRLQDCLVCLHSYDRALVIAEQCRARTLGELMLLRKQRQIQYSLQSPLSFEQMAKISENVQSIIVYLSYTGARLIGWLFIPQGKQVSLKMFEVPLADDQFDGKSFDYYLRYSLTEELVERRFEMYKSINYDNDDSSFSVQNLHRLIARPILDALKISPKQEFRQLVVISDSYTTLLPLTCLLNPITGSFLGDAHFFRGMPSFLTMGIMNQLPYADVSLPADTHEICVIGDPAIPPFKLNEDVWVLGKLPYAYKEAEWVAHALHTSPILGERATKMALINRLMSAKVVHIATHGSASLGFLAFSSFAVAPKYNSRLKSESVISSDNVLLYPREIEELDISPALVVLSSCDSGRGTVKADGIQGMARAFILAGAQSVLTTLWKVPDESASIFMQFFYQYLMDGFKSSLALHKAILSVRCFAKYSQYIHWSGYQLTGRDTHFCDVNIEASIGIQSRLGEPSVFPRLHILRKLEKYLITDHSNPTYVQILEGCAGVKPSEVAFDFIISSHKQFAGGIFWICCRNIDFIASGLQLIEKVIGELVLGPKEYHHELLIVLDGMTTLPHHEKLIKFLKQNHVHIIVICQLQSESASTTSALIKDIDRVLTRGCTTHTIEPLTVITSTQRIVHTVLKEYNFTPNSEDQNILEELAEFTLGSPVIADLVSQVLVTRFKKCDDFHSALKSIADTLSLKTKESDTNSAIINPISRQTSLTNSADAYATCARYDSWKSILHLIALCHLQSEELLLLRCLSIFGCSPVSMSLVTEICSTIAISAEKQHFASTLHTKVTAYKLIRKYPFSVISHKSKPSSSVESQSEFICVPQELSDCLLADMEDIDYISTISVVYHSIKMLNHTPPGLMSLLMEMISTKFKLLGEDVFKMAFSHHLSL